jgi:hypothetical protein
MWHKWLIFHTIKGLKNLIIASVKLRWNGGSGSREKLACQFGH